MLQTQSKLISVASNSKIYSDDEENSHTEINFCNTDQDWYYGEAYSLRTNGWR